MSYLIAASMQYKNEELAYDLHTDNFETFLHERDSHSNTLSKIRSLAPSNISIKSNLPHYTTQKTECDTPLHQKEDLPIVYEDEELLDAETYNFLHHGNNNHEKIATPQTKVNFDVTLSTDKEFLESGIIATGFVQNLENDPIEVVLHCDLIGYISLEKINLLREIFQQNNIVNLINFYEYEQEFHLCKKWDLEKKEILGKIQFAATRDLLIEKEVVIDKKYHQRDISYYIHKKNIQKNTFIKTPFYKKSRDIKFSDMNFWQNEVITIKKIEKTTEEFIGVRAFLINFLKQYIPTQQSHSFVILHHDMMNSDDERSIALLTPKNKIVGYMDCDCSQGSLTEESDILFTL